MKYVIVYLLKKIYVQIFSSKMTRPGIRPIPAEIEYNNMRFLITEQPQVWFYLKLKMKNNPEQWTPIVSI